MQTPSESKIILVDMDGVIADQHLGFLNILKTKYPEVYTTYQGTDTDYEFELNFPAEHHAFIKSLREQKGFFASLPLIPGAKEALTKMREAGYDVYICTAPIWNYHHCVPEKFEWIERELGRDWVMSIYTARDKTIVRGAYLIDDSTEVKGKHIPEWEHLIFDRTYNLGVEGKRRIDWSNWQSIIG